MPKTSSRFAKKFTKSPAVDPSLQRLFIFFASMLTSGAAIFSYLRIYEGSYVNNYSYGLWTIADRPSWLPFSSRLGPLLGPHYFGDFFQFYYIIRSHFPYTDHTVNTSMNPGYLFPAYTVSWISYPSAGYIYMSALLALFLLPFVWIATINWKNASLIFAIVSLSVPAIQALGLGQPQIILFVCSILTIYFFEDNASISAIFLGIAIAIKPYMAIYLLLFLLRRDYRSTLRALALATTSNAILAFVLAGKIAFEARLWHQIAKGFIGYGSGISIWAGNPFLKNNSSLFSLLNTLHVSRVGAYLPIFDGLLNHYLLMSIVIFLLLMVPYFRSRKSWGLLTEWTYLTAVILLIPSFMLGYAWLLLLVPIVSVACHPSANWSKEYHQYLSGPLPYFIILAVAIYPVNILGTSISIPEAPNGNSLVTPIMLLTILAYIIVRWTRRSGTSQFEFLMANSTRLYTTAIAAQFGVLMACIALSR